MNEFEMRFYWDNPDRAAYKKTLHYVCHGMIKTWKLSHETDEQYQERTRRIIIEKARNIKERSHTPYDHEYNGITSIKFR